MRLAACVLAVLAAFIVAGSIGEFVLVPAVARITAQVEHAMTATLDNRGLHD